MRLVSAFSSLEARCGFVGDQESGAEGWNKEEVSGGNPTTEWIHDQEEADCCTADGPGCVGGDWSNGADCK